MDSLQIHEMGLSQYPASPLFTCHCHDVRLALAMRRRENIYHPHRVGGFSPTAPVPTLSPSLLPPSTLPARTLVGSTYRAERFPNSNAKPAHSPFPYTSTHSHISVRNCIWTRHTLRALSEPCRPCIPAPVEPLCGLSAKLTVFSVLATSK